jgi:hypothetical protein
MLHSGNSGEECTAVPRYWGIEPRQALFAIRL